MLKIEGLNNARRAVSLLGSGEHLWIRGIGDVLIYVRRLSDSKFRLRLYSVGRVAKHFTVKGLLVNGSVKTGEVVKLIEKLSARPCRVVVSDLVDAKAPLAEVEGSEMSYLEFVKTVRNSGVLVQANPLA